MRDMTKAQYEKKVRSYGFSEKTIMGYRRLPAPLDHISVSEWNGGDTYRGKLTYLLDALAKSERREEKREAERAAKAEGVPDGRPRRTT